MKHLQAALFSLQSTFLYSLLLNGGNEASQEKGLVVMGVRHSHVVCVSAEVVGEDFVLSCKSMAHA